MGLEWELPILVRGKYSNVVKKCKGLVLPEVACKVVCGGMGIGMGGEDNRVVNGYKGTVILLCGNGALCHCEDLAVFM